MGSTKTILASLMICLSGCVNRSFHDSGKSKINDSRSLNFAQWYDALPNGPIANFELTSSVVFHKVGAEILPDFQRLALTEAKLNKRLELTNTGGNRGSTDGGVSMVWMRDYSPIVIKSSESSAGGKARFINYLSMNPSRNSYTGTLGSGNSSSGLLGPSLINIDRETIGSEKETLSTLRMPLVLEGGNLVSSGDHIFLTEHVYLQNSPEYSNFLSASGRFSDKNSVERSFRENGFYKTNELNDKFEYRSPEQVRAILSKYLEVKDENIITLPVLPGEGTHHVDLFLLALGKKHIMIPEITDEGISTLAFEYEKTLAREARDFLNQQAELLRQKLGYRVDRLAMIPPIYQVSQGSEKQAVYFSPANVLLFNMGPSRKLVFVPHFDVPSDWGQPFKDYSKKTEDQWKRYFEENGWQPIFVTANKAARAFGLIRCLTAPIPFLSERHMNRFIQLGY